MFVFAYLYLHVCICIINVSLTLGGRQSVQGSVWNTMYSPLNYHNVPQSSRPFRQISINLRDQENPLEIYNLNRVHLPGVKGSSRGSQAETQCTHYRSIMYSNI
jgi:hypothetical protein